MEFTTEQFGQATREVFSGSVSQTEEIIEKHGKVMDKLDKKKKDVKEIIGRGEKLAEMAKAPQFLGEKLAAMNAFVVMCKQSLVLMHSCAWVRHVPICWRDAKAKIVPVSDARWLHARR